MVVVLLILVVVVGGSGVGCGFLVLSLIELHNNLVDLARTSGGHTSCKNLMGHTPWRLSAERTITIPPTSSPTCLEMGLGNSEEKFVIFNLDAN